MKKLLLILIGLFCLCGCRPQGYLSPQGPGKDMSGYGGLESDHFVECGCADFLELADQKNTVAVLFGYEDCQICNALVPILNEVLEEKALRMYYVDMKKPENLEDMDVLDAIMLLCKDYFAPYSQDEAGFPLPCIVYLKKGEVVNVHIGTVSGVDVVQSDLTEHQKARLRYNLEKEFGVLMEL